jgi:hypothetical protein
MSDSPPSRLERINPHPVISHAADTIATSVAIAVTLAATAHPRSMRR